MYLLDQTQINFPHPSLADEDGLLAIGGDLSIDRLKLAYANGIFPWYTEDDPILWYAPHRRMVLPPHHFKPSKSLQQTIKKGDFTITFNQEFNKVITTCKLIDRKDILGTWITQDIINAYTKLHELGIAKSVEVWQHNELVGGLYGIDLGHVFCGESMFSKVSNASKVAFAWLNQHLAKNQYELLDCQVHNSHLESLGAFEISQETYLKILQNPKITNSPQK